MLLGSSSALGTGPIIVLDDDDTALLATIPTTSSSPIPNDITVQGQGDGTVTLGTTRFTSSAATTFAGTVTLDVPVTFQGGNSAGTDWLGAMTAPDGGVDIQVISASGSAGNPTMFGQDATAFAANIDILGTGTILQSACALLGPQGSIASEVSVAAGATWSLDGTSNVAAIAGTGTVELNGYTLTVGGVENLSFTLNATIADGSAPGNLIKAGTGALTLAGADTSRGNTTVAAGSLTLGAAGGQVFWTSNTTVLQGAAAIFTDLAWSGVGLTNAGMVTLTDCTFSGHSSVDGGGVSNSGTVTLSYCTITGDSAADGGGVYNSGTATLSYCTITGDSAVDGGGVYNSGTATLSYCTITGDSAVKGGGVCNRGMATLSNCTIESDASQDQGGGVMNAGKATLTDCTLSGDSAGDGGGVSNSGTAILSHCTITGDSAVDGGGVYNSGTATLSYCTITGDSAKDGGGVCNLGTTTLANCTIESDASKGPGGGLMNAGTATLDNCTLSGDSAVDGGGLYDFGTVKLTDCTVSGNSATHGGGMAFYGKAGHQFAATLTDCTIDGNSAGYGGGVYSLNADTVTLTGCTISNDVANRGAGLFNEFGALALTNCTISGNSASEAFGGGLSDYGTATITACTITGNTVNTANNLQAYGGGLLAATSGSIMLTDTIVAGNSALGPVSPSDIRTLNGGTVSGSYNLIGTGGSGGLSVENHNLLNVASPGLGALGNYGGPTQTIPLLLHSPAVVAGTPISGITTDQRGAAPAIPSTSAPSRPTRSWSNRPPATSIPKVHR